MDDNAEDVLPDPSGFELPDPHHRIGDRDLWVGDRHSAHPSDAPDDIEHSLGLMHDPQPLDTAHIALSDARRNDPDAFAEAVDVGREYYRADGWTLIHCAAGVSRSATIAALVLAIEEDRDWEVALAIIEEHREPAHPHRKLVEQATDYLAEHHPELV